MELIKEKSADLRILPASCETDAAGISCSVLHTEKLMKIVGYYEAEELARIILEESADSVEPFGTFEDMVEYIREALNADHVPIQWLPDRLFATELQGGQGDCITTGERTENE